jgi:hypothetical protein
MLQQKIETRREICYNACGSVMAMSVPVKILILVGILIIGNIFAYFEDNILNIIFGYQDDFKKMSVLPTVIGNIIAVIIGIYVLFIHF